MSCWIEYQAACFEVRAEVLGLHEPRYIVATEGGPNNLTEPAANGRERCVRSWAITLLGTRQQVLRQAVRQAAACEGGEVKLRGRRVTPEAYIRRARALLRGARDDVFRHIALSATVAPEHVLVAQAEAAGLITWHGEANGRSFVKLIPRQDGPGWAVFLKLVEPLLDQAVLLEGMGEVHGLSRL